MKDITCLIIKLYSSGSKGRLHTELSEEEGVSLSGGVGADSGGNSLFNISIAFYSNAFYNLIY